jgi:hypothetical protein
LSEILEAENLLFRQVWYNRHWHLRTEIEEGKHQALPESEYSYTPYLPHQTLILFGQKLWRQLRRQRMKSAWRT